MGKTMRTARLSSAAGRPHSTSGWRQCLRASRTTRPARTRTALREAVTPSAHPSDQRPPCRINFVTLVNSVAAATSQPTSPGKNALPTGQVGWKGSLLSLEFLQPTTTANRVRERQMEALEMQKPEKNGVFYYRDVVRGLRPRPLDDGGLLILYSQSPRGRQEVP
jgi:hypothetical protein